MTRHQGYCLISVLLGVLLGMAGLMCGCKSKSVGSTLVDGNGYASPRAATVSEQQHQVTNALEKFIERVKPCPEEANMAALRKLNPVLGHYDETSPQEIDAQEKAIACYRPWAAAITDSCQRDSIEYWLDFYEGEVQRNRRKLTEGKPETSQAEWDRQQREEAARIREWERKNPFPKLPQCESKPEEPAK